jgi:KaiC/GvpD/RAD55 family RecA-like ATPase
MAIEHAALLKQAMEKHVKQKYGHVIPPAPYITPFGIKTVDALLGGGFQSSSPICISSTPETGKSTTSLQFASIFLQTHPDSIVVYINIEEAAGGEIELTSTTAINSGLNPTHDINDRINSFNIDSTRFINKPVEINVKEVFELISELIAIKKRLQERDGKEYKLLIIWDSVAKYIWSF